LELNILWEIYIPSDSEEIPSFLWDAKFYCSIHKSPPVSWAIWIQSKSCHPSFQLKLGLPKWHLPLRFSD